MLWRAGAACDVRAAGLRLLRKSRAGGRNGDEVVACLESADGLAGAGHPVRAYHALAIVS